MPDFTGVECGLDSTMPACLRCGGRIHKSDIKCFTCELPTTLEKPVREVRLNRARVGLKIAFFLCLGLTIASLFTDVGPSFVKCLAATVIIHFVKESAIQMSEPKGS